MDVILLDKKKITTEIYDLFEDASNLYISITNGLILILDKRHFLLKKVLFPQLPSNKRILTGDSHYFYASLDWDLLEFWKVNSFSSSMRIKLPNRITALCVDNKYLYIGYGNGIVQLRASRKTLPLVKELKTINSIPIERITTDDMNIYVISSNCIEVWDKVSLTLRKRFYAHVSQIVSLIVDENYLYTSSVDKRVKIWDKNEFFSLKKSLSFMEFPTSLISDKKILYIGFGDGKIRLIDLHNHFQIIKEVQGHFFEVSSMIKDDTYLYSASKDGTVKLWATRPFSIYHVLCMDSLRKYSYPPLKNINYIMHSDYLILRFNEHDKSNAVLLDLIIKGALKAVKIENNTIKHDPSLQQLAESLFQTFENSKEEELKADTRIFRSTPNISISPQKSTPTTWIETLIFEINGVKYKITRELTEGGTSHIFLAEPQTQNMNVSPIVIKYYNKKAFHLLLRGLTQEDKKRININDLDSLIERYWIQEADALSIQSHSPEPRTLNYLGKLRLKDKRGGIHYLIFMEYLKGESLLEWLKRTYKGKRIINRESILDITQFIINPMLRHLSFVHDQGVVHRDLTITNVVIVHEAPFGIYPIIIDWGTAKKRNKKDVFNPPQHYYLNTPQATFCIFNEGTAPELSKGLEPVAASDIYMMGYLWYLILTGEYMKDKRKIPQQRAEYTKDPQTPFKELNRIILKMTQYEPSLRYVKIEHLQQDINRFLQTIKTSTVNGAINIIE